MTYGPEIELKVRTANSAGDTHGIYFNRGTIPSQAFADRFGTVGLTGDEQNDPDNEKVQWLSRGLLEAVLAFIAQANGSRFALRIAAYEFFYPPVLEALRATAGTGVKIHISFHAGDQKQDGSITHDNTSTDNLAAIASLGLDRAPNVVLRPRTLFSNIPHNKFFLILENGVPRQILTGSTNITPSGFLGQSNVAHIVRDDTLAGAYNTYWEAISADPATPVFKKHNTETFPDPVGPLAISNSH